MPLNAPPSYGGDFKLTPMGTHRAICNRVIDLGRQRTTYLAEETIKHQIYLRWELPDERIEWEKDGEALEGPAVIGKTYTFSLHEKANLCKDLESWRGKIFGEAEKEAFDMFRLLGTPCQVTVTHRESGGKTYANVTGVAGWPKGMEKPKETERKPLKYSQDYPEAFPELPEWLRDKIQGQVLEEQGVSVGASKGDVTTGHVPPNDPPGSDLDEEIPF